MSILKSTRQRGLSMVELLVALAISSFLILGITQVYIGNKRNYVFQQSQANNQENTRFAEYTLNTWLNKAGYRRAPDQFIEYAFPAAAASSDCKAFDQGSVITDLRSDTEIGLCIRYQPASSAELDCQGNTVKTSGTKLERPFVNPDSAELVVMAIKFVPDAELNKGTLQCKNLSGVTPAFAELLDGVADMRLEFATGESDLFEKKLKDNPWAGNATGLVRAVRYSMLLASRTNQRDSDSKIYTDWIATLTDVTNKTRIENSDNRRVYQLAGNTQSLRNMMP
jgi:type IV pilus assembly protein PilW